MFGAFNDILDECLRLEHGEDGPVPSYTDLSLEQTSIFNDAFYASEYKLVTDLNEGYF